MSSTSAIVLVAEPHAGLVRAGASAARPRRRHGFVDAVERHALPGCRAAGRRATPARARPALSPAITASAAAHSATVFAIGPIESSVNDSGNAPSVGTRCLLGFQPTMPHSAAGMRVEPPVSVPIAISHMPSATATAPPEVEPPGTRARSNGLPGVPKCGLAPTPENANSLMLVLATITAPAARSRCTTGASAVASSALLGQHARARARHLAGDVEQVLDADDRAVERAERLARPWRAHRRRRPRRARRRHRP